MPAATVVLLGRCSLTFPASDNLRGTAIVALSLLYRLDRARAPPGALANTDRIIAVRLTLVLKVLRGGPWLRFADWTQHAGGRGRLALFVLQRACTWILIAAFGALCRLGRREPRTVATS